MSTAVQPLLLELFTEELPPKALNRLGQAFVQHQGLVEGKEHKNARERRPVVYGVSPVFRARMRNDGQQGRAQE